MQYSICLLYCMGRIIRGSTLLVLLHTRKPIHSPAASCFSRKAANHSVNNSTSSIIAKPLILTITVSPGFRRSRVVLGCFLPNRFQLPNDSCSSAVLSALFFSGRFLNSIKKNRHSTAYSSCQRFCLFYMGSFPWAKDPINRCFGRVSDSWPEFLLRNCSGITFK